MCRIQRSGRWDGDVLILGVHGNAGQICAGSDRAELGEPEPVPAGPVVARTSRVAS